jgi:hypothetical protein
METVLPTQSFDVEISRAQVWTGRVLTGLISAFLLLDALGKLLMLAPVVEASRKVGFAEATIFPLGVVLFVSTLLHLLRRTQLVGAVLLTAYLGGAVATHVHLGTGASSLVMPVVMGVLLWVAYGLRNPLFRSFLLSTSR